MWETLTSVAINVVITIIAGASLRLIFLIEIRKETKTQRDKDEKVVRTFAFRILTILSKDDENARSLIGDLTEKEKGIENKAKARLEFWKELIKSIFALACQRVSQMLIRLFPARLMKWFQKQISK